MAERPLAQVGHLQPIAHRVVAVERQQGIQVHQHGGEAPHQEHRERGIGGKGARRRDPPHDRREAGQHHLDPGARRGDPQPRLEFGKGPRVVHIAEEGEVEVEHHHPDLVHLTAEVFAGVAVGQLVHRDDDRGRRPDEDVVPQRGTEQVHVAHGADELRPFEPQDQEVGREEHDGPDQEFAAEEELEVGNRPVHELVGVAEGPAEPEDAALEPAGAESGAPLGPEPFHQEHGAFPNRPLAETHRLELLGKAADGGRADLQALLEKLGRRFGHRALAIERLHDGDLDGAEAEILPGRGILHDEALFPSIGLLDEHQVGAESRTLAQGPARTTFSPGASPLTTSTRSPGSSPPTVTCRSEVRSASQTRA